VEVQATLNGQLLLSGVPADSGTVILHEVTPEVARSVDSVRVHTDGTFAFTLPRLPIPGSGEVYFVSSRYNEILYLGPMIGEPAILDTPYIVEAYSSVLAPSEGVRLPVSLREVWIEEGPLGWRFTDIFQITNPTRETLVPTGEGGIVWSYPLPDSATGVRVLDTGLLPGEIRAAGGILRVSKPIVPGSNRIVVQYDVPSLDFVLPLPGEVALIRVVMYEPVPPVQVEGLARMEPAEVEPGVFVAYWAGEGLLDQRVSVRSGRGESRVAVVVWFSIALALLLAAAGVWGASRKTLTPQVPSRPQGERRRSSVLLDIAQLDHIFGEGEREKAEYLARRATLMRELDRYR